MTSSQAEEFVSPWLGLAKQKLDRVLGCARSAKLIEEILQELNLQTLSTPEQLVLFGERLATRGGFLSPLGTSLQIQVMMHRTQPKV